MQHSAFGIMPPPMMPLFMSAGTSSDLYGRDERVRVVLVLKNAADICHGYKALRVERAGYLRRGGVGVYVIDIALVVAADGRNDRDISLVDNVE